MDGGDGENQLVKCRYGMNVFTGGRLNVLQCGWSTAAYAYPPLGEYFWGNVSGTEGAP